MPWWIYALEIIGILVLGSVAYAASKGAPWVPTWKKDSVRIAELAELKAGETFYELGCGDGRVCTAVSDAMPHAKVIGVELGFPQWLVARLRVLRRRERDLTFRLGNIFSTPLHDADVVYVFLMPEPYAKLKPKLEAELKSGSRVITYVWPMEGWTPERVHHDGKAALYVYRR